MKEIDFLPEWYKEGKRRRVRMRWQCIALSVVFLAMITYNTISAHRIAAATAALTRLDEQRIQAESVMHEFDVLNRELTEYQAEVESLQRMDSRIEPAAVLAEISHIVGPHIVLSRLEFIAEPVAAPEDNSNRSRSSVRVAGTKSNVNKREPLGDVRFRIVLAGVAARPENVGELVCRLEASSFFRNVHPSGFRNSTIEVPNAQAQEPTGSGPQKSAAEAKKELQVSEFEITCYLANYEEIEGK
ncbi:MAG: hypothetical protein JSW27_23485 [Phycisphaerales bacterium]|nr:MAG: hypothetical protein JSW27_23485 [Phycisphaerales bacterium]